MHRPPRSSAGYLNMQFRRQILLLGIVASIIVCAVFWMNLPATEVPQGTTSPTGIAVAVEDVQRRLAADLPPLAPGAELLTHLVIVPGHGTIKGGDFTQYLDEAQWALEPFQVGRKLPAAFAAHIRGGLSIAAKDPTAVLVFSGGQTRADSGTRSEAQTYMDIAVVNQFDGTRELMNSQPRRIFAEEFARDSYENVLFSIARFYEATGRYPERITVVGFAYKERRFVDLHRVALRWALSKFTYVGIDPKPDADSSAKPLSDAATIAKVREDLYMCKLGKATRAQRNPNRRAVPYYASVGDSGVRALLLHCGPKLFAGTLPWSSSSP